MAAEQNMMQVITSSHRSCQSSDNGSQRSRQSGTYCQISMGNGQVEKAEDKYEEL